MSGAEILARDGALVVHRPTDAGPEIFVVVDADGVTAFNGHVDLGTGIATALAQVVAEELDVALPRVRMVLGTIGPGPDQGATIASTTLQVTAIPLRAAAAQARNTLLALAAEELGVPADQLTVQDGVVSAPPENRFVSYATLLQGRRLHLVLDLATPVKAVESYRVVGQPAPRRDIPDKATGAFAYVQDMRVPGMLHGRVVRPPYAGLDAGAGVGASLIGVDERSVADIPGLAGVVVIGDFVGVVAAREEHAARAAEQLAVSWRPGPPLPDLSDIETVLRGHPATARTLLERGDVDAAIGNAAVPMRRTYVWPFQMHASIGPSCAVADWRGDRLAVWSGTQNPHALRDDLALLMAMPAAQVTVHRMEAAGCYGRNCADDVTADAALLSRAVGRPVRVQLTRAQEHQWEPKGAAQLMDVGGGLDADGQPVGYDFSTCYPSNRAPTLALILTGALPPIPAVSDMGDRTAVPPYAYDPIRVVARDMAPIVRAAWLRGVSALPNTFAHESFIDELAIAAGVDPVAYRLRYLTDPRAIELLQATVAEAGWEPRTAARMRRGADGLLHGQGVAYARYVHSTFPGFGAAWSAWVADVAVDPRSGDVTISRIVVGQDSGLMVNPDGVRHQLHGNVVQSISRVLKEEVRFDDRAVTSREWGAYPILTFPELPPIQSVLMARPDQPPLGAGESASVPSAAAIANAIFDATGVRFRAVPFTPERIRAGLSGVSLPAPAAAAAPPRRRSWRAALAGAFTALAGVSLAAWSFPSAIDAVGRPDAALYSAAAIARGRQLAAVGNCVTCHTAPGGIAWAGGRRLHTPFGSIVTPNLTPDATTGIGGWSYAAFARALRDGIARDGRHLYPAMPYPAFRRITEDDMQALYAFLMSQDAVAAPRGANALRFPFNLRPLLAGWNALFLGGGRFQPDPAQSDAWNRGAYLVAGLGHCGGCHTARNVFGAAHGGAAVLAGGVVDDFEAPALNGRGHAPLPWTEADFFDYLRTGYSEHHGPAAGPMAAVVRQLRGAPDADIRAMAVYLASLAPTPGPAPGPAGGPAGGQAERALAAIARTAPGPADNLGARLYDGACAACHQPGRGPALFGVRPSLALNSNVHAATPDTLIRVILHGIDDPALPALGAMPGFAASLDDAQVAALVGYIRAQFAPDRPAWQGVTEAVRRWRRSTPQDNPMAIEQPIGRIDRIGQTRAAGPRT